MEIKKQKRGFTLIELLVYVGILSILLGIGGDIFAFVIRAYQRAEMISSIELLGNSILTQVEQDVRVSQDINIIENGGGSQTVNILFSNGRASESYTFNNCSTGVPGGVSTFNFGVSQNFFRTQPYLNTISSLSIPFLVRTRDSSLTYDMLTISFALSAGGADPCTAPVYTSYFQTIVNLRGGISN